MRANVCGIDCASSLADVCNTNDNEAFKPAARPGRTAWKRGGAEIGRPSSATLSTRFDDINEEAFETPAA